MLHRTFQDLEKTVKTIHFDGRQAKPEWIRRLELVPLYRRRFGQPVLVPRYN